MQSFVWFVSACRIWTGAILWVLDNEPEQKMVCCTGWKEDRDLSCSKEPEDHSFKWLCNQSQRQGSLPPDFTTSYIHMSICTSLTLPSTTITTIPVSRTLSFFLTEFYPDIQCRYCPVLTKSSLLVWGTRYLELCPGQLHSVSVGEAAPSQTANALLTLISLLWVQWGSVGRTVRAAHFAQLYLPQKEARTMGH